MNPNFLTMPILFPSNLVNSATIGQHFVPNMHQQILLNENFKVTNLNQINKMDPPTFQTLHFTLNKNDLVKKITGTEQDLRQVDPPYTAQNGYIYPRRFQQYIQHENTKLAQNLHISNTSQLIPYRGNLHSSYNNLASHMTPQNSHARNQPGGGIQELHFSNLPESRPQTHHMQYHALPNLHIPSRCEPKALIEKHEPANSAYVQQLKQCIDFCQGLLNKQHQQQHLQTKVIPQKNKMEKSIRRRKPYTRRKINATSPFIVFPQPAAIQMPLIDLTKEQHQATTFMSAPIVEIKDDKCLKNDNTTHGASENCIQEEKQSELKPGNNEHAHAQSSLSPDLSTEDDEVIILDSQPKNITKGFQHQKEVSQIKKENEIYIYTLPCLYQSQNMLEDNSQQPMFEIAVIPEHIFSHLLFSEDFNATGDGKADDTNAVRAAFNAAAKNGGGRVIFDEGYVFLTGCFNVTSNIILDIRGVILASNSSNDYVAVQPLPWYGGGPDAQMTDMPEWQSVIRSYYAKNITITGGGLIDGQGQAWWNCSKQLWEPPCNWLSRPPLIRLIHTKDIVIENIYLKDSPIWTLHLANTTNVYINNINITAPWYSLNTDGIDIDCSVNVLVNNSYYSGGDDAIAIKSGIDLLGREYGRTSENITVQNMIVGAAGGLSIGSEMSGGVRNVTFQNISMDSSYRGIFIKSQRGRGGIVQDINYINITLNNVNSAIYITMNYSEKYIPPMGEDATPKFKNITITNVLSNQATFGWNIDGLDESVIQNVYFSNIKMMNTASSNLFIKCDNIYGTCDNTSVLPYCPKCIHKEEECFDTSNDCSQYINVCNNPAYHAIMCSNCRKSCNLCESC